MFYLYSNKKIMLLKLKIKKNFLISHFIIFLNEIVEISTLFERFTLKKLNLLFDFFCKNVNFFYVKEE